MSQKDNLENHIPMVQSIVNSFYIPKGLDRDDLVQVGLIGIWKASKTYKPNKNTKFSTYAYVAARNEILHLLRKQSRLKPEQNRLLERHAETYEIEQGVIDRFIKEDLEEEEETLIRLLYQGYTQREIAKVLGLTQPSVCQRIRRLRIKGQRKWGEMT